MDSQRELGTAGLSGAANFSFQFSIPGSESLGDGGRDSLGAEITACGGAGRSWMSLRGWHKAREGVTAPGSSAPPAGRGEGGHRKPRFSQKPPNK